MHDAMDGRPLISLSLTTALSKLWALWYSSGGTLISDTESLGLGNGFSIIMRIKSRCLRRLVRDQKLFFEDPPTLESW